MGILVVPVLKGVGISAANQQKYRRYCITKKLSMIYRLKN
jgi:hypothetical protein